jgi:hypothetical protein
MVKTSKIIGMVLGFNLLDIIAQNIIQHKRS